MKSTGRIGFTYHFELIRDGRIVDDWTECNLIPTEGLDYLLSAGVLGGSQLSSWFIGLYGNDYTPQPGDKAATFPALAGEITAYQNATRHALVASKTGSGVIDNAAARIEVSFTADTVVHGGFISSVGTKGSTSGVLLSAVRNSSPKPAEAGDVLRVTAGLQLTSAS